MDLILELQLHGSKEKDECMQGLNRGISISLLAHTVQFHDRELGMGLAELLIISESIFPQRNSRCAVH